MLDASSSTARGTVPARRLDPRARARAFKALYDRHFRLVWSVVRGGGVPAAQCEDVAQETWIQVHRLVHRLRDDASERAWLVSIARKRVLQHHRSQHRRERRELQWGDMTPRESEGERVRVEARSMVDRMLDRMSEDQRLVFVLVHGYGLTGEEVAAAVGDSVNTIYSRLRLARRYVRRVADAAQVEERRVARTLWSSPPPRRTEQRMWAGLVVRLGMGPSLGAGSSLAAAPGFGLGLGSMVTTVAIAGIGLALLRSVVAPAAAPDPGPPHVATQADAEPVTDATPAPTIEPTPAIEPTLTEVAAPPATQGVTPPRRAARAARAEAELPTLAAEAALLKDAKQALNRNAPAEALAILDEHARRFPDGTLEDVRRGARIRALCALGRGLQARGEAQLLASTHEGSVVARGVEDVCERGHDAVPPRERRG